MLTRWFSMTTISCLEEVGELILVILGRVLAKLKLYPVF